MNEPDSKNVDILTASIGCVLLSERDYIQFVSALDSPKPPTRKLWEAMAEYQRLKAAYPNANL